MSQFETDQEIKTKPHTENAEHVSAQSPENQKPGSHDSTAFFPVSEGKLITLYILSFGFYGVYWFYQNWKRQQPLMDKKIYPLPRAIFSIFFTHSLFKRIDQQASQLDKKHQFNANALATFFVATIVLSYILDRIMGVSSSVMNFNNSTIMILSLALFFLSTYPLLKVQATVNRINNDILGYLNYKYSLWNYILIISGAIIWLLFGLGLLAQFMGLTVAE